MAVGEGLRFLDLVAHEFTVTGDGGGGQKDIYVDPNDWDGDGLTNDQEKKLGTNPKSKDSDNDGVDDKTEIGDVNNPKDSDGDGKKDAIEPDDFDTDNDGIFDSKDKNDDDGPCSTKGKDGPPRLFYDKVSSKDIHLTKKCSPYKVVGSHLWMIQKAKLSSEAGVTVLFAPAAALKVGNTTTTGALDLKGSPQEPVLLKADSQAPKKGFWRGVVVENGTALALQNVSISWAGGPTNSIDAASSMLVKAASSISLSSCTFSGSPGYGLHAAFTKHAATLFTAFNKNAFTDLLYSAALNINHLGEIQNDNQFGSGGEVHVSDGTVARSATWKSIGVPYKFKETTINVDAALTIREGATLIFAPDTIFLVGYNNKGNLKALGTQSAKVTFKTVKGSPGSWQGLMLTSGSSTLNNVQIMGAGKTNYQSVQSALYLDQAASLTTVGTHISNSSGMGVYYFRFKSGCTGVNPDTFTYGVGITSCKFFCLDEINGQGVCLKK